MNHKPTLVTLFILFACIAVCSPQRSSVQGRYLPPPSQERPCTTTRCSDADKSSDRYGYDDYRTPEKTDDRPTRGGDYKPKPDASASRSDNPGYGSKPAYGGSASDSDYKPKPEGSRYDDDGYRSKPVYGGSGGLSKPRDEYVSKPIVVESKSEESTDYKPKPVVRDEYQPKPVITGSYGARPVDRYDSKPKPTLRDDYVPKPKDDDEYKPKPVDSGVYNLKPVESGVYNSKPVISGVHNQKPKEHDVKPSVDHGYDSKPVDRDDYGPKPYRPAPKDDDVPKPAISGSYPKPYESDRGDYASEYYPKPYPGESDSKPSSGVHESGKYDDYNDDYKTVDDDTEPGNIGKPVSVIEDSNCICVPYYQCKDGHIVTDGAGIIDARRRPAPDEELPLDGKFKPPSCGPFHVCCNTPESSTVKPYEHRCGVRNPSGINSRILSPSNKGEADFGEWPWQAAVLKSEGTVNIFQCGGVLIDKYHVLTVAHCVFHLYKYNEYPLKVRLGEWDTQTTSEFLAHEDYKVSKITIHPEYRNTSLWNDIAILRLQEPVLFAPHIDTVCLPKYDEIFAGQNCVVTGWGKDSYKGGTFSNVMKEVALQVIDNYGCEEMLRKTRLGRFFQLHEGFICAGGEHGLDSCKGDGGGPLVCYRKDRSYALAGLVSWGIDCGQPGVPGVYLKVQKYLDWISKNTGVNLQEYWPKA